MLIFYHHHLQLSSLCNWPSSAVCLVYNIPSLGVKGTSSVLWSSANFCSISQNMHYKAPVASQHWKTNKVVWTWKDDWPPWRTSTYERHFTWEGNYLVLLLLHCTVMLGEQEPELIWIDHENSHTKSLINCYLTLWFVDILCIYVPTMIFPYFTKVMWYFTHLLHSWYNFGQRRL